MRFEFGIVKSSSENGQNDDYDYDNSQRYQKACSHFMHRTTVLFEVHKFIYGYKHTCLAVAQHSA